MHAVRDGARAGDPLLLALTQRTRAVYGQLRPALEADEVAAALMEQQVDRQSGTLHSIDGWKLRALAFRRHFARRVLLMDVPASAEELQGILLEAQEQMRTGRGWWYPARAMPAPKPMGPKVPARDLAESESMLRQAKEREEFWPRLKEDAFFIGAVLVLLVCVPLVILGPLYGIASFLRILFRL